VLAREAPGRLFIGVDASAAGLRELSNRALRLGLSNVLYVRAAVEALPPELRGLADRITVILPWGSLLSAVARPVVPVLADIRALGRPGAKVTAVMGVDPVRDRAEAVRLGLPDLGRGHFAGPLAEGYAAAGLTVSSVRAIGPDGLARWPSSWAGRLTHGAARPLFVVEAQVREG
jgi:hypothetical protein